MDHDLLQLINHATTVGDRSIQIGRSAFNFGVLRLYIIKIKSDFSGPSDQDRTI